MRVLGIRVVVITITRVVVRLQMQPLAGQTGGRLSVT